jgi:hypothetical protein
VHFTPAAGADTTACGKKVAKVAESDEDPKRVTCKQCTRTVAFANAGRPPEKHTAHGNSGAVHFDAEGTGQLMACGRSASAVTHFSGTPDDVTCEDCRDSVAIEEARAVCAAAAHEATREPATTEDSKVLHFREHGTAENTACGRPVGLVPYWTALLQQVSCRSCREAIAEAHPGAAPPEPAPPAQPESGPRDLVQEPICGKAHPSIVGAACESVRGHRGEHAQWKREPLLIWPEVPCAEPHPNVPGVTCYRERGHPNAHRVKVGEDSAGRWIWVDWVHLETCDEPHPSLLDAWCLGDVDHRGDHHTNLPAEGAGPGGRLVQWPQPLTVRLRCGKCGGEVAVSEREAGAWTLAKPYEGLGETGMLGCPFCHAERGGLYPLERDEAEPRPECADLGRFLDGELGEKEAEHFRDHFAECSHCQATSPGLLLAKYRAEMGRTAQESPAVYVCHACPFRTNDDQAALDHSMRGQGHVLTSWGASDKVGATWAPSVGYVQPATVEPFPPDLDKELDEIAGAMMGPPDLTPRGEERPFRCEAENPEGISCSLEEGHRGQHMAEARRTERVTWGEPAQALERREDLGETEEDDGPTTVTPEAQCTCTDTAAEHESRDTSEGRLLGRCMRTGCTCQHFELGVQS